MLYLRIPKLQEEISTYVRRLIQSEQRAKAIWMLTAVIAKQHYLHNKLNPVDVTTSYVVFSIN